MQIGYDGAYAPSAEQAACLRGKGGTVFFGYLNTPGVYHPWSDQDFATLRAAGFVVIPVAFGVSDHNARLAISECRRLGFKICVVDCESNDGGGYLGTWAENVRAAGISSILYGLPNVCRSWAGSFDALWAANYRNNPGTNVFDSGIAKPQGWQWWNSHGECGAMLDQSWLDDWFVSGSVHSNIPPPPQPAPLPIEESHMKVISSPDGRAWITDGIVKRYIEEPTMELPDLLKVSGQTAAVAVAQYTIDRMPEILPVLPGHPNFNVDLSRLPQGMSADTPDAPDPRIDTVLALLAEVKAAKTTGSDPAVLAVLTKIETALKGA